MTITVNTPDGGSATFPDGTDPGAITRAMQQKFGAPDPAAAANAAGQAAGQNESPVGAAFGQAAQQGFFGLDNYVNAGARWAAQRLAGVPNADDYSTDLAYSRGQSQGEAEGHPVAATVGGVGGALLGGGALGQAVRAVRGASVAAKAPGAIARLAGGAATGGISAGLQAVGQGQDTPTSLQTAGLGALLGGPLSVVTPAVVQRLLPAAQRAYALLAKTIGMKPDDLAAAVSAHEAATGAKPSMGMIADSASQGRLHALAALNPELAAAARTAADQGGAPLHEQLAALTASGATKPQNAVDLSRLSAAQMTDAMDTVHPATGVPLRDAPAPDPNGVLTAPHIDFAMRPNTADNARLSQPSPVLDRIANGTQTVGDVDTVRKALRNTQDSYLLNAPGAQRVKDPALAKQFGDIATQVEDLGRNAPDVGGAYGAALDQVRADGDYGRGFKHGLSGKPATTPSDDDTAVSLMTPSGLAGYTHGQALSVGQKALNTIAPPATAGASGTTPAKAFSTAASAVTGGVMGKIIHGVGMLTGNAVSPQVQAVMAKQLFDPASVDAGVANLRRAKVSQQAIADFARTVGGSTGASIANSLQNSRPTQ